MMRTVHLFRAAALFGLAVLIAKLFAVGQMALYMSPSLDPLTVGAGVISACLGLCELRSAVRGSSGGGPHAGPSVDHAVTVGLVFLPVILGLLVTPHALNTSALGNEDLSRLVLAYPSPPGNSMVRPVARFDEPPELFAFLRQAGADGIGQQVRVMGMVAHGDSSEPTQFVLLRYSIVHCVADARPIGVLVLADAALLQPDEWVEIVGALDTRERDGEYLVALRASSVTQTNEPPNPYLPPM